MFYKHYNESNFNISMNLTEMTDSQNYQLEYDVYEEKWIGISPYELDFGAVF